MREYFKTEFLKDLLYDVVGSVLIAIGVHNFALHANFPVAGFSGIAIIMYHLLKLPVGASIILLNIPVSIFCYRYLGKKFFYRSVKTTIISSLFIDYVAPLFPVYTGSRLLAALCMGILCGVGYTLIFMRGASTGGQDFITMSIKKTFPHISLGTISFSLDILTITAGSLLVFKDIDGFIYGMIVTYISATVMNRILYGVDQGKMTLIVTDDGEVMAKNIARFADRGSTIISGIGSYTGQPKDIVMCACNNKEMYTIKKLAQRVDEDAFTIIMQSNEVVGEGFSSVGLS